MVTASIDYQIGHESAIKTVRQDFPTRRDAYAWVDRVQEAMRGSGDRFIGYDVRKPHDQATNRTRGV